MNSTRRTFLCGATRAATWGLDFVGGRSGARLYHDVRLGHLARFGIGTGNDRRVGYCRMRLDHRFEFGRRHLVPLVLDQLLDPVDDVQITVLVRAADVAGVQPAVVVDHRPGGVAIVQVAFHHLWTPHPDLAQAAGRRILTGRDVDHPEGGVRRRRADGCRLVYAVLGSEVRHRAGFGSCRIPGAPPRQCAPRKPWTPAPAAAPPRRAGRSARRGRNCRLLDASPAPPRWAARCSTHRHPVLLHVAEKLFEIETRHGDHRRTHAQRPAHQYDTCHRCGKRAGCRPSFRAA